METLEKMSTRKSDVIISQPITVKLEKQDVTIVNSNSPDNFFLYPPSVTYAVWDLETQDDTLPTNLTIAAGIYLPEPGDYNSENVRCVHYASGLREVMQGYLITFDFPDNQKFDHYRLYNIVIMDALDLPGDGSIGTEFSIEVFLGDVDPKLSRGTVTTVLKSA